MRKPVLLFLFALYVGSTMASGREEDSVKKSFIKNFNISTVWFEYGAVIPIHESHLRDLPNGLNHYLFNTNGEMAYGFFSLGLYYKERFGVEVLFRHSGFYVEGNDYRNYIAELHPDYYVPAVISTDYYSFEKLQYRICYRFYFKHFFLEPKFQLGINDYTDYDDVFSIKEKGSNQFISYRITKQNLRKNNFSYHFILNTSKRFDPFESIFKVEAGVKFEFMMVPTSYNYTIEEKPYGKPAIINQVHVKQLHPALGIEAFVYFFFKK